MMLLMAMIMKEKRRVVTMIDTGAGKQWAIKKTLGLR